MAEEAAVGAVKVAELNDRSQVSPLPTALVLATAKLGCAYAGRRARAVRTAGNNAIVQNKIRLYTVESGMPSIDLSIVSEDYVKEGCRWRLRHLPEPSASYNARDKRPSEKPGT